MRGRGEAGTMGGGQGGALLHVLLRQVHIYSPEAVGVGRSGEEKPLSVLRTLVLFGVLQPLHEHQHAWRQPASVSDVLFLLHATESGAEDRVWVTYE